MPIKSLLWKCNMCGTQGQVALLMSVRVPQNQYIVVRSDILRIHVFWDVTPCCWASGSWRFEGLWYLLLRLRSSKTITNFCIGYFTWTTWPLQMKAPESFKMLRTSSPVTRPEDLNPRQPDVIKVSVKLSVHTMKSCGNRGIAPRILNLLSTQWK
jgi:hypothetical protein